MHNAKNDSRKKQSRQHIKHLPLSHQRSNETLPPALVPSQGRRNIRWYPVLRERQDGARHAISPTVCPDGFARIDNPLKLRSRNSRILEYARYARKVQRRESQLGMQVKLSWEYVESEYMHAVEACGAKYRQTRARARDVGLRRRRSLYVSVSVCLLRT